MKKLEALELKFSLMFCTALVGQISANGYQIVVAASHPTIRQEVNIANIHVSMNCHQPQVSIFVTNNSKP